MRFLFGRHRSGVENGSKADAEALNNDKASTRGDLKLDTSSCGLNLLSIELSKPQWSRSIERNKYQTSEMASQPTHDGPRMEHNKPHTLPEVRHW